MQHGFGHAGVANDFMAQVASDTLSAFAPEHDFFLHVQNTEAARKAFKNVATEVGVVKGSHNGQGTPLTVGSSAKRGRTSEGAFPCGTIAIQTVECGAEISS